MAENDNMEIPPHVEKLLFATDLVNYIFSRNTQIARIVFGADQYRDYVVNIFNENIRTAADFLNTTLGLRDSQIFDQMMHHNFRDLIHFKAHASQLKSKLFCDGFDPDAFLRYSVHLASLSANFYLHGVKGAPAMAVKYIIKTMKFNLSSGVLETLDMVAQKYVHLSMEVQQPSPNSEYEFLDIIPAVQDDESDEDMNDSVFSAPEDNIDKCIRNEEENQHLHLYNQDLNNEQIEVDRFQNQHLHLYNKDLNNKQIEVDRFQNQNLHLYNQDLNNEQIEVDRFQNQHLPLYYQDLNNEQIEVDRFQNQSFYSSDKTQVSHLNSSATEQNFESNSGTGNSYSTPSSYLATSDYIAVPGTSRDVGTNVVYQTPGLGCHSQNSASRYHSSELAPGGERNSKRSRIDTEFTNSQEMSRESCNENSKFIYKNITPPSSDTEN